jgi:hypothetical protein
LVYSTIFSQDFIDPITLATAITTIFFTGVLQKQGENFSDVLMQKVGKALDFIRKHSPDTAVENNSTFWNKLQAMKQAVKPGTISTINGN